MNKNKQKQIQDCRPLDFREILALKLKDPKFRRWFDYYGAQLETAYKIAELRRAKKFSQEELAKRIGTTQSNVARLESGQQNFSIFLLSKIAKALDLKLDINFSDKVKAETR